MARPIPVNRHSDASSSGCGATLFAVLLLSALAVGYFVLTSEPSMASIVRPVEHLTVQATEQLSRWASDAGRIVRRLTDDVGTRVQMWLQRTQGPTQSSRTPAPPARSALSGPTIKKASATPTRTGRAVLPTPSPTPTPVMRGSVTAWWLNLRTGPGMEFAVLDELPRGTGLEILGQRGIWLRVRVVGKGTMGWVSSHYVELMP